MGGVDLNEGAAGLGDRPQRGNGVDRARQRHRDYRFRSDTPIDQNPRPPVGGFIEFAVRQPYAVAGQRFCAAGHSDRVRQHLRQHRCHRAGPPADRNQRGLLDGRQQLQFGEREVDIRGDDTEHPQHSVGEGIDLLFSEQFGQVLEAQVQLGVLVHDQTERIVRGVSSHDVENVHSGDVGLFGQPGPVDRVGLEDGHGVEHRAGTGHLLDPGESEVMMVEQRGLFGLDSPQ